MNPQKKDAKAKKERQSLPRILKNNLYLFRFAMKFAPSYIVWSLIEGVVWGMIHSFTSVIFTKMLFDRIGAGNFSGAVYVIGLMAGFALVTKVFHYWYWQIFQPKISRILHLRMQEVLFEKARSLDLACYDDPAFYNDFVFAVHASDGRVSSILFDLGKLVNRIIATFTIAGVLLTVDGSIVAAILLFVGISALITRALQKLQFQFQQETVPLNRKISYVSRVFAMPDYAKELRTSSVQEPLLRDYENALAEKKRLTHRFGKKRFALSAVQQILSTGFLSCGILTLLTVRLFQGAILLGDFAAANNAIWKLRWQISSLMEYLMKFPEHSLYAEKFRRFMEYEPKVTGGSLPVSRIGEIAFRNVSFRYSEDGQEVLKNISFTVKKGEKIAIVGYNGAGKSTLLKLLMHLYDPVEGEILADGRNLRELKMEEYRGKIAAAFQDSRIFAATLGENVLADVDTGEKRAQILQALEQAAFSDRLRTLPEGLDTQLTREFSERGVNLSGGEAQKVAIARAFAGDAEILILDEPSSALDPMAEYALNRTILHYTADKTVVFISHRLSTTRMADRIYMFSEGMLIEEGSHDALMEKNGKYAEMFRLQAEKYQS